MTNSKQQRFEIDLDDIERQLRRAVEPVPVNRPDPLAELARIVGQDDPFRDILAGIPAGAAAAQPAASPQQAMPGPNGQVRIEPTLTAEDRDVLALAPTEPVAAAAAEPEGGPDEPVGPEPAASPPLFDPVKEVFGSPENAVDRSDFQPLRPRRSRARLVAVAAVVGVGLAGTAGVMLLRGGGSSGTSSGGAPPVIKADTSPLKVVPADPGGVDIPNQDRQIYDRAAQEPRSRLVDRQEQPIDVKEAARALPTPPPASSATQAPGAATGGTPPVVAGIEPTPLSSVTNALGAPRRVRTVTVRPDGSPFTGDAATAPLPASPTSLPPPVPVATVPVPVAPPQTVAAMPMPAPVSEPPPVANSPAVTVLPPPRPRPDARPAPTRTAARQADEPVAARDMAGSSESGLDQAPLPIGSRPQRNAARVDAAPQPAISPDQAAPAGGGGGFVVNLATRSNEARARSYSGQLSAKYASDLGGRRTSVVREDVDGKPGFRVRVGPVSSRQEADGICDRLKSAGASCTVASGN